MMLRPKLNNQRGLTMVELIMAVAVTGIIIAFLGTAIYQIMTVSVYGNDHLSAQHELQNAASWFHFDIQGAVTATGGSQLTLMLSDNSTVTYARTGAELRRSAGSVQTTVARNISSVVFSVSGQLATMNLVCVPSWRDNISENGSYTGYLRPVAQ
jgi:prepilin-type N-terminal cleavage/methylation domain-containing protein